MGDPARDQADELPNAVHHAATLNFLSGPVVPQSESSSGEGGEVLGLHASADDVDFDSPSLDFTQALFD